MIGALKTTRIAHDPYAEHSSLHLTIEAYAEPQVEHWCLFRVEATLKTRMRGTGAHLKETLPEHLAAETVVHLPVYLDTFFEAPKQARRAIVNRLPVIAQDLSGIAGMQSELLTSLFADEYEQYRRAIHTPNNHSRTEKHK